MSTMRTCIVAAAVAMSVWGCVPGNRSDVATDSTAAATEVDEADVKRAGDPVAVADEPADTTVEDEVGKDEKVESVVAETPEPEEDLSRITPPPYSFRPGRVVPGKLIALTFDDGPSQATPKVLAALRKYGAVATFFVVGGAINGTTSQYMRAAVEQGCEIASHTWDHPYMSTLDYEQTRRTIDRTNEAIRNAVGYTPNFYRPPYIDADKRSLTYAGMPAVAGISSDDWMTDHTPQMIAETVLKAARPNAIIVMHDLGANHRTPVALDTIIPELQRRGYTLVTVTDMFTSAGVTPRSDRMYINPGCGTIPGSRGTYRERMKAKKKASATAQVDASKR